jgi:hypothetical protein
MVASNGHSTNNLMVQLSCPVLGSVRNPNNSSSGFSIPVVHETVDGGFVAVGHSSSITPNIIGLLRVNASGDLLWIRHYLLDSVSTLHPLTDVCETSDGGFLMVGSSGSIYVHVRIPFIIKIDADGIVEATHRHPSWADSQLTAVIATHDGNYMVAGYDFKYFNGRNSAFLIKVGPAGALLWNAPMKISDPVYSLILPRNLQQLDDDSYILAGNTWLDYRNELFMMKISEQPAGVEQREALPVEMDLSDAW